MGIELPSIGGEDNAGRARRSGEEKMISGEADKDFEMLKNEANKQAVHRFKTDQAFVEMLRNDVKYEKLKDYGNFEDETGFMELAEHHHDYLKEEYGIESIRAQAALLASMAQLDFLVDVNQLESKEQEDFDKAA